MKLFANSDSFFSNSFFSGESNNQRSVSVSSSNSSGSVRFIAVGVTGGLAAVAFVNSHIILGIALSALSVMIYRAFRSPIISEVSTNCPPPVSKTTQAAASSSQKVIHKKNKRDFNPQRFSYKNGTAASSSQGVSYKDGRDHFNPQSFSYQDGTATFISQSFSYKDGKAAFSSQGVSYKDGKAYGYTFVENI